MNRWDVIELLLALFALYIGITVGIIFLYQIIRR